VFFQAFAIDELKFCSEQTQISATSSSPITHIQTSFKEILFEKEIGEGTYGTVWLGKWNDTPVALKFCKSKSQNEEFMNEMKLMMYVPIRFFDLRRKCRKYNSIPTICHTENYLPIQMLFKCLEFHWMVLNLSLFWNIVLEVSNQITNTHPNSSFDCEEKLSLFLSHNLQILID
jgi:serine/threonine protein kinase